MYFELFLEGIHQKILVRVTFLSKEKGVITRICVPFDCGPSRKYKSKNYRYHFYDLDSPDGKHNLSILPSQIIELELMEEHFEPGDYVHWDTKESPWFIPRDWGMYS